jgi:hypothetical protein
MAPKGSDDIEAKGHNLDVENIAKGAAGGGGAAYV